MIPTTSFGNFLRRADNRNASIFTLVLPEPESASYQDTSSSGQPTELLARQFGAGECSLHVRGLTFTATITLNHLHDVVLIDRIG